MKKIFTEKEVEYIIENYSTLGPKQIAKDLNCSLNNIRHQQRQLGLFRGVLASNKSRKNDWKFKEWSYDLGYIIGVYLGDGHIQKTSKGNWYFRLTVIDKDFCEITAARIKEITGYDSSIRQFKSREGMYVMTFSNNDFCLRIKENFGGAKEKRLYMLPDMEANKGMMEGLFDSDGTSQGYTVMIRLFQNLQPLQNIITRLGIKQGGKSKGAHKGYEGIGSLSFPIKEYTRVGLGTYVKRKAKNGIVHKQII